MAKADVPKPEIISTESHLISLIVPNDYDVANDGPDDTFVHVQSDALDDNVFQDVDGASPRLFCVDIFGVFVFDGAPFSCECVVLADEPWFEKKAIAPISLVQGENTDLPEKMHKKPVPFAKKSCDSDDSNAEGWIDHKLPLPSPRSCIFVRGFSKSRPLLDKTNAFEIASESL